MTNTTRGLKRICPNCGARFYDLGKNPAPCPKCGTQHDINAQTKIKRKPKATITVDDDDPLLKAKENAAKAKLKKPVKEIEDIDLEEFEDIETLDADEELSEIEEIEDIDAIEELEEIDEPGNDDESTADDIAAQDGVGDDALIDDIEELEEEEEEGDEPAGVRPDPKGKRKK